MKSKIKLFLEDNDLSFSDSGSGLNSSCCILAGYVCYLNSLGTTKTKISVSSVITIILSQKEGEVSEGFQDEFKRVYSYAVDNNYGEWWKSPLAKSSYKF